MARRPRERSRKPGNQNGGDQPPENGTNGVEAVGPRGARIGTDRGKIIEAFMDLLGELPIEEIDLTDIAARAGVSMADMRGEFGSKLAILAAHIKDIDREVLSGDRTDMAEEPAARAFVRRADAPPGGAGALQGGHPFAAELGADQSGPRLRAQQPRAAVPAMDAGGCRSPERRTGRDDARAGACHPVRASAGDLRR